MSFRAAAAVVLIASGLGLAGCDRLTVPFDEGEPARDEGRSLDSGYDPVRGNAFSGPMNLDDARVNALDPSGLPASMFACRPPVLAQVTHVRDGDTIEVDGVSERLDLAVRLIGIDTPEEAREDQPAECFSDEATDFTEQLRGRRVWLTFGPECFDRFDRLLAHVHVGGGEGDFWQRQILRRGLAETLSIRPNTTFSSRFAADRNDARAALLGLWSACR